MAAPTTHKVVPAGEARVTYVLTEEQIGFVALLLVGAILFAGWALSLSEKRSPWP